LGTGTVGLTSTAAALVWKFRHGDTKRAWAAAELLPMFVSSLGFGACGSAPTTVAVGGIG
jgi:hypothetical protein